MNKKNPQVIVFQEDENALNYRYKLPFTLNSDIEIKSIDYDVEEFIKSGVKLIGPRPTKDSIYYLHPYKNNEYIHESQGEKHLLEEKLNLYRRVGALLGAKSISTKVLFTESKKLEIDAEGKVKVRVLDINTNVNYSKESDYKRLEVVSERITQEDNFDLNKNIDKLRDMIDELNLHHELGITSLIDGRDSRDSGVSLSERKVSSEITSEYNSLLQISAQLSSPIFSVSTDFKRSLETVNKLNVDIEFIF